MRRAAVVALAILAALAIWYLRDPSWLIDRTTGMREWRQTPDGLRWRWTDGHASFFAPADARSVRIMIATPFDPSERNGDRPALVTLTIDDRRAARVVLGAPGWKTLTLSMPPRGGRRVRRIDLRVNVTRGDNRGVQISEPEATMDGQNWRRCCFAGR